MFLRIWLINLFLAVFVIFFGLKAYGVWSEGEKTALETQAVERREARPKKRIVKRRIPPESAYSVVVESNLFSRDRAELKPEKPEPGPEGNRLKVSRKKIILYGVIIMDDYKAALVGSLEQNTGWRRTKLKPGERKAKWIRVGDTVGNFRVAGIKKDRIFLAEGAREHEILLYDKDKPKRQVPVTKKAKPTVVREAPKKRTTLPQVSKRRELSEDIQEAIRARFEKTKRER